MTHKAGDIVGSYELVEKAGEGASGEVWKAVHREWKDRFAAVKFSGGGDRNVHRLDHPNIVRVEDQDSKGDPPYLLMEWVEGETLRARLDREKKLPEDAARRILIQILRALDHAHDRDLVHGDLKPSNILIGRDDEVKVADFGQGSPVPEVQVSLKADDKVIGSVGYLAPEVKKGADPDRKSDLYSVGAVLHEMLTGQLPPGKLEGEWDRIVSMLLTDREHRFAYAVDVLDALDGKEPVDRSVPWYLESWFAGPMTLTGVFFIAYLCLGMRMLQPMLRFVVLVPGVALTWFFARGIRAPIPTILFWGGGFWAYAARGLHFGLALGGVAISVAGAVWYLATLRRRG